MERKTFPAVLDNLEGMIAFVLEHAGKVGFSKEQMGELRLASEEALVNVVRYAYPSGPGSVDVACGPVEDGRGICIEISDSGIPFDPLSLPAPDTNLSMEQRKIGGLGIFMIRKIMDKVLYRREGARNVLTLYKNK
ncbi:MAG TPA: ATP-binding protein [Elusimicrobiota bacterium]|nr:ATP-binding protein [Elusimicrobiota bacterium]